MLDLAAIYGLDGKELTIVNACVNGMASKQGALESKLESLGRLSSETLFYHAAQVRELQALNISFADIAALLKDAGLTRLGLDVADTKSVTVNATNVKALATLARDTASEDVIEALVNGVDASVLKDEGISLAQATSLLKYASTNARTPQDAARLNDLVSDIESLKSSIETGVPAKAAHATELGGNIADIDACKTKLAKQHARLIKLAVDKGRDPEKRASDAKAAKAAKAAREELTKRQRIALNVLAEYGIDLSKEDFETVLRAKLDANLDNTEHKTKVRTRKTPTAQA